MDTILQAMRVIQNFGKNYIEAKIDASVEGENLF
jgi:hypothetical protein